jgi:glycosyltransferase involved in cell wall biosynthesis
MKISIGILGKNSEWILKHSMVAVKQTLSYLRNHGVDFEVIYVDGGSRDGSVETVKKMLDGSVRVVNAEGTNIPEARNVVIRESTGDYIVFWDSDIIAPPHTILRLVNLGLPIAAPDRRDIYIVDESDIIKYLETALSTIPSAVEVVEVPYVVFSVTAFKREVFEKVGVFDERMTQAEDRDFGIRARCRGIKSYLLKSDVVYDINRRLKSDVPITTPLRQYIRGVQKKAAIYAYSPSPRQRRNMLLYGAVHGVALISLFTHPLFLMAEMTPLAFFIVKYKFSKGVEMWLKSLIFYTSMIFANIALWKYNICEILDKW